MRLASIVALLAATTALPACFIEPGRDEPGRTVQCESLADRWNAEVADLRYGCVSDSECVIVGGPPQWTCNCAGGIGSAGVAVRRSSYAGSSTQALAARFEAEACSADALGLSVCDVGELIATCEQNTCVVQSGYSCWETGPVDGGAWWVDAGGYPDADIVIVEPDAAWGPDGGVDAGVDARR